MMKLDPCILPIYSMTHDNHSSGEAPVHAHEKTAHTDHGTHDMKAMSRMDHEKAMTDPAMAKQMEADMRRRFWISLVFTIPIVLYSSLGEWLIGFALPTPIPVN